MANITENKLYTYSDYLNYPEGERIEIIDGHIYRVAAAPSRIHQSVIMELSTIINSYIKSNNGSCKVYSAPFDVILKNDDEQVTSSKNIVQPDISVICDKSKLTDKGCTGAPDMIIEVVSPYNSNSDYIRKLNLYYQFKVREYWIVNPMEETILVYSLNENCEYAAPKSYTFKNTIKVGIYDNLEIDFNDLDL
ncbi:Uma2 family endonuclease [Clostridium hydrogenum]|uniref:Uma2 family endonuclease n=1 Tax=Clostridium hydrogenum TaxID=2855764 RepID=UPI001F347332|nr:Uma2 family endonuclease [Clostridium hydrogenum]